MRALLRVLFVLVLFVAAIVGALRYFSTTGEMPDDLGVRGGRLGDCPRTTTCVTSQAEPDDPHYVEPLPLGDPDTIGERLQAAVTGLDALPPGEGFGMDRWQRELQRRATVELGTANESYLYASVRMPWIGLTDDLELAVDESAGVVHVRSASRVGNDDLGVNRLRVEMLREALAGME